MAPFLYDGTHLSDVAFARQKGAGASAGLPFRSQAKAFPQLRPAVRDHYGLLLLMTNSLVSTSLWHHIRDEFFFEAILDDINSVLPWMFRHNEGYHFLFVEILG